LQVTTLPETQAFERRTHPWDVPITGNNPDADTVARTRISANVVETISKKAGKVVTTQQSTVSADGKTRPVTTKGVNAAGQKINNVAAYERQ
jgi:hypothetical protein